MEATNSREEGRGKREEGDKPFPFSLFPLPFRLIDTPPAPGAWNMAVDEALMESVRAGDAPALRFYRWSPACLSLGRNQPAAGRYDLAAIAARS